MNILDTNIILNIITFIMVFCFSLSLLSLFINRNKYISSLENIERSKNFSQFNKDINNFDNSELVKDNESNFQFKENCSYNDNFDSAIFIDKETGIEYIIIINKFNNNFAICPQYNKDGILYITQKK